MALSDALALTKNEAKGSFYVTAPDLKPSRKKLIGQLDTAAKQINEGKTNARKRIWKKGNGGIAFMLTLNDCVVEVGDETWHVVPEENVPQFIDLLKEAIDKGELDDEIEGALFGNAPAVEFDVREGPSSDGGQKGAAPKRTRSRKTAAEDAGHPKFTDPNWSTYSNGERIKRGLAYKNSK